MVGEALQPVLRRQLKAQSTQIRARKVLAQAPDFYCYHLVLVVVIEHDSGAHLFRLGHGRVGEPEVERVGLLIVGELHEKSVSWGPTARTPLPGPLPEGEGVRRYPIFPTIASPNSEHLRSLAPSIWRSKS